MKMNHNTVRTWMVPRKSFETQWESKKDFHTNNEASEMKDH